MTSINLHHNIIINMAPYQTQHHHCQPTIQYQAHAHAHAHAHAQAPYYYPDQQQLTSYAHANPN